jgi:asparagine synthetase B (glutamine-hydrolysing)
MCGIFLAHRTNKYKQDLDLLFNKIQHRGPDYSGSHFKIQHRGPDYSGSYLMNKTYYGFHRLAIINPSSGCNQPFCEPGENLHQQIFLLCNG